MYSIHPIVKGQVYMMQTKTKVWTAVSVSALLIAGAGSVFAASGSSSQTSGQHAKGSHFDQKGARGEGAGFDFTSNSQLLALLHLDAATLKNDLKAGQSLADIAAAQKVDEQQVIDLLVADFKQKLASAVQAGKITQAQADQKSANIADQVKQMVERKGAFGKEGPLEKGELANNSALLALLNIDAPTLQKDLKAGQSLADIAVAQKVDEQKVIDLLVSDMQQQLASAVQAGKLTQAQADQKSANIAADVKQMVERKGAFGKLQHGQPGQTRPLKKPNSGNQTGASSSTTPA
ncbi:MAG: hypothetical protein JWN30_1988 [Bacilli bacterium]|nr:hypothetical protein [Bacilli bacterium]